MSGIEGLLAAGFGLGLSVAAPLGPVSAAAIREGLEQGPRSAFLLGLGAATVDFLYLGLVWVGVAPMLLRVPGLVPACYGLGAALLIHMAWGALRRAWLGGLPEPAAGRNISNPYLFGLAITVLNPATILSWLGLGSAFASAYLPGLSALPAVGALLSVAAGSAAWFGALALGTGLLRRFAGHDARLFRLVNLAAGLALGGFGLLFASKALGRG